ncbi:MAG: hypothetical protein BWY80_01109 [Firmicutes bacterium ADurb.Bin456]|nr:MAG: hypothetical protein BWY80_01109 [Firmicutes bacterium ADurb.Bin456]
MKNVLTAGAADTKGNTGTDFLDRTLQPFHFFQHLQAALGAPGGILGGDVASHKFLHPGNFPLLAIVFLNLLFHHFRFLLHKARIITGIAGNGAAFQLVNDPRQGIQEITVMGNNKNCPAVGTEVLFQPGQVVQIQVVGGFIQN